MVKSDIISDLKLNMDLNDNTAINFEELAQLMDYYENSTPVENKESAIPDDLIEDDEDDEGDDGLISYKGFVVMTILVIYLGSLIAIAILKAKGYSFRLV